MKRSQLTAVHRWESHQGSARVDLMTLRSDQYIPRPQRYQTETNLYAGRSVLGKKMQSNPSSLMVNIWIHTKYTLISYIAQKNTCEAKD